MKLIKMKSFIKWNRTMDTQPIIMWNNISNDSQFWIDSIVRLCVCVRCSNWNNGHSTMHVNNNKIKVQLSEKLMIWCGCFGNMAKWIYSCKWTNSISPFDVQPFSNWIADLLIRCEMNCLSIRSNVHRSKQYTNIFHSVELIVQCQRQHQRRINEWFHNVSNEIVMMQMSSNISYHGIHALFIILWFRMEERWRNGLYRHPEYFKCILLTFFSVKISFLLSLFNALL